MSWVWQETARLLVDLEFSTNHAGEGPLDALLVNDVLAPVQMNDKIFIIVREGSW